MATATLPRLTSCGRDLDTDSASFGRLESSIHLIEDVDLLRENGYLYLPGYLDRAEVMDARLECMTRLSAEGFLDPAYPLEDGIASPDRHVGFKPDLAIGNQPLLKLLYQGRMMDLYARILGGEVLHFDYTWMRAVSPGNGTNPHCDIVYMGRGTTNLYTSWTPLGDVPFEQGGLMVLEGSHTRDRLIRTYGQKDVDKFCINRRGEEYTGMGGGGNIAPGGVLSPNPVVLRERLGGRWLTTEYKAGDLLVFGMYTVHASLDNHSRSIRLSSDTRYQLASEPVDERWVGEHPIAHGPGAKKGLIC